MRISNKSIVPGILIKSERDLGYFGKEHHLEEHFYILTEIKTIDGYDHEYDMLIFYDLIEERFISVYCWYVEESIGNGTTVIVA